MINFITDMDSTLIYSKHSVNNHKCVCIDKLDERNICFITEQASVILKKLISNGNFRIIPCTARSYEQAIRISFLNEYCPNYMICDLGASIYIDGKKEDEWEKKLLSEEIIYPEKLIDLKESIEKTIDLSGCKDTRLHSGYFMLFCFREEKEALDFYNKVNTEYYKMNGFSFRRQKLKVYCYPNQLDKSLAVSYLINKNQLTNIITSGDSLFDYKFNKLGDIAILPKHAEFKIENAIYCEEEGIKSGEHILDYLYNYHTHNIIC